MGSTTAMYAALAAIFLAGVAHAEDPAETDERIRQLVAQLRTNRTEQVEDARRRLVEVGARAVPALVAEVWQCRRNAATTLALLGDAGANALAGVVEGDAPQGVKEVAAHGLGAAGSPGAHTAARLLASPDKRLRLLGSVVISSRTSDLSAAVPAMVAALDDPNRFVRLRCATALGSMDPAAQAAVPALVRALNGKDVELSVAAGRSLAQLHVDARHLPAIHRCLERSQAPFYSLCEILEKFGPQARATLPMLRKHLNSDDPYVRVYAARAVWSIGRKAAPVVAALVKSLEDEDACDLALETLAEMGPAAQCAVVPILRMLGTGRESTHIAAVHALGRLGVKHEAVYESLRFALRDVGAPRLRLAAASALWALGAHQDELVPRLLSILRSWDTDCQVQAATLLGVIGDRDDKIIAALEKLSRSRHEEPREAAVRALKRLNG